jgi:hypothetical protein
MYLTVLLYISNQKMYIKGQKYEGQWGRIARGGQPVNFNSVLPKALL